MLTGPLARPSLLTHLSSLIQWQPSPCCHLSLWSMLLVKLPTLTSKLSLADDSVSVLTSQARGSRITPTVSKLHSAMPGTYSRVRERLLLTHFTIEEIEAQAGDVTHTDTKTGAQMILQPLTPPPAPLCVTVSPFSSLPPRHCRTPFSPGLTTDSISLICSSP